MSSKWCIIIDAVGLSLFCFSNRLHCLLYDANCFIEYVLLHVCGVHLVDDDEWTLEWFMFFELLPFLHLPVCKRKHKIVIITKCKSTLSDRKIYRIQGASKANCNFCYINNKNCYCINKKIKVVRLKLSSLLNAIRICE